MRTVEEQKQQITFAHLRLLPRLFGVREKLAALTLFILVLISGAILAHRVSAEYSVAVPTSGGVLREGVVGIPHFINPLLATSDVDRDLVSLLYAGLMRIDGAGAIVPSLAERYETSSDGLTYTFVINADARWSDGEPVTADDILFTISLAKNPTYRSSVRANWEGVIVEKIDERTVQFTLAKPYAPFLENTVLGILPKHVWQNILPAEFGLAEFNTKPVGAGPYTLLSFHQTSSGRISSYTLEANKNYLPHEPFIKTVEFYFYGSENEMLAALRTKKIDAAGSLTAASAIALEEEAYTVHHATLPRVFGIFFNQNASKALADANVRSALELATNKQALIAEVLKGNGEIIYSPIPPNTFGALDSAFYKDRTYNPERARALITSVREKNKDLKNGVSFSLTTSGAPELVTTARLLADMWKAVGIDVTVHVFEISDFEQNVLRPRKYDAVLFGEIVGHDPDPFAFWHSSQRNDPGLNIALYTNPSVDTLLEKARTTIDPDERRHTYEEFQKLVAADNPALFLYSPFYLYAPSPLVQNNANTHITLSADRFADIHMWYIRTKNIWKIFAPEQ